MSDEPSPEWETEAVLSRLEKAAGDPRQLVSAQLFLNERVAADDILSFTAAALASAAQASGAREDAFALGKALPLARSIEARAPVTVLRELMKNAAFTGLLPTNLSADSVMIKPIRRDPELP